MMMENAAVCSREDGVAAAATARMCVAGTWWSYGGCGMRVQGGRRCAVVQLCASTRFRCVVVAGPGALQLLPWLREGDDGGCRRRWMQVVCSRSWLRQLRERMAV